MKNNQTTQQPTRINRPERPAMKAFRQPTIARRQPATTPLTAAKPHPHAAHEFLAICYYPGMGDHCTAA